MTSRAFHGIQDSMQETRKRDHIELTNKAQTGRPEVDSRFYYEPMQSAHPNSQTDISTTFLGKKISAPFWISSMTGGVGEARHINQNLARVCREFSLGMGLGSCRTLLDGDQYFADFNLRPILGPDLPLFANLGIAQVEKLVHSNNANKIFDMVNRLDADGLIVHVNPLQEWFQPEGDKFEFSPIVTIAKLCNANANRQYKIIVKEVGQGMGPKSLKALLELPIDAIELASFGGTNFSKLELLRSQGTSVVEIEALSRVGHTSIEMISMLNNLLKANPKYMEKQIIISGGIENFLDGFYLQELLSFSSIIGQAKNFLNRAENYSDLIKFTEAQIEGLKMARAFLTVKPRPNSSATPEVQ
ncbi:MAG: type 2 isopentenyl-diphosphate Delta-isomerase [Bacteriovorax sp.]|nr:type 2 isopentenyl-diphosphate Delta-isomerase [Bacteriovorax sp.]